MTDPNSFADKNNEVSLQQSFHEHYLRVENVVVEGEPSPGFVDNVAEVHRDSPPDVIIAVGGGSTMDAGKAISAMIYEDGSVTGFLEVVGNKLPSGRKVPFIAVPTTAGTGSEATKNAVLSTIGQGGFKRSLRHDNYVPDIAVVDPLMSVSCPPQVTASCGMDCFTQLVEAYLSTKSGEYTDALALKGLLSLKASLLKAYADGSNTEARTGMSFSALTSGICLANAGLGSVHGFASSIGARYHVPHGVICGTMMAVTNDLMVKALREEGSTSAVLAKYAELGRIFSDRPGGSDTFYTDSFIALLYEYTEKLGLPRLRDFGVDEKGIPPIAADTENKNNPVRFSPDELKEILFMRL